jgi:spore photoproduct lyase
LTSPDPLSLFGEVSFTEESLGTALGRRLLARVEGGGIGRKTDRGELSFRLSPGDEQAARHLLLATRKGPFLKPCPGTPRYLCCGYRVLAWAEGCPLGCSYCILTGYFHRREIILFTNLDDLLEEVARKASGVGPLLRLGTGEFTDSLFLEPLAGLHRELIPLVGRSTNIILEVKSKIDRVEPILDLQHRGRTIAAWSLNTPDMAARFESQLPPVEERLAAAARASSAGYHLAFHFDPLIHHPGWEKGYRQVVDLMADMLPGASPVWISLGTLRFPSRMPKAGDHSPPSPIFPGEFHRGDDGKMRYLRPLRTAIYRHVAGLIREAFPGTRIYLCMENRETWHASLGVGPSSTGEVSRWLDEAALEAAGSGNRS